MCNLKEMEDSVLSAYSEARSEYMKQLLMHIAPTYFSFFLRLYNQAKTETNDEPKRRLWQFQTYLAEIPDWNMERVRVEIERLERECDCDYMEDLLTAVFIAYTKVLTAIRLNTHNKKVNITIPKIDHFFFKSLCECAKILWQNTFLFREDVTNLQRQQNYREVEKLISEGITQAVRSMTPIRSILKDCIAVTDDSNEQQETTQEKQVSDSTQDDDSATAGVDNIIPTKNDSDNISSNTDTTDTDKIIPMNGQNTVVEEQQSGEDSTSAVQVAGEQQAEKQDAAAGQATGEQQQAGEQVFDVTDKEPTVKFTNVNTVFTIDDPESSDMNYADPDLESVSSFETDTSSSDSIELEDNDAEIDAESIHDGSSVGELSDDDFTTL